MVKTNARAVNDDWRNPLIQLNELTYSQLMWTVAILRKWPVHSPGSIKLSQVLVGPRRSQVWSRVKLLPLANILASLARLVVNSRQETKKKRKKLPTKQKRFFAWINICPEIASVSCVIASEVRRKKRIFSAKSKQESSWLLRFLIGV